MSTEERNDLEQRAKLAECTFGACFKSRLASKPSVMTTMGFETAINEMVAWASELMPKNVENSKEYREVFRDAQACSERLQELTSEIEGSGVNCPWPFIRKIR